MKTDRVAPPDQAERDLIDTQLDINMLVEAAAGTGKTTKMVDRMVALLRHEKCAAATMAAVTFTRKAAAELRARFQIGLERAFAAAEGDEKQRLGAALERIEQCFIGTIHSLCARILRERPVEAGVDLAFEELDEEADARLREEAWRRYVDWALAENPDGVAVKLREHGLDMADLQAGFLRFATFPDVDEWPDFGGDRPLPDLEPTIRALLAYVSHMREMPDDIEEDDDPGRLVARYRRLPRMVYVRNVNDPADLMDILAQFSEKPPSMSNEARKTWAKFAKEEQKRWKEFAAEHAVPLVRRWYARRYSLILRVYQQARAVYDRLRRERGQLNFQDLLLKAAGLLANPANVPHVREYFRRRFTHLLVDEFQDTDPIQAQVMLLLTADNPRETDWRRCVPAPGSLFVVGDPKQSIYRFRRADIVTYNEVRAIIAGKGRADRRGLIVQLRANFRTVAPIIGWVNGFFQSQFPDEATPEAPPYVALAPGRVEGNEGELRGVRVLRLPGEKSAKNDAAVECDADLIACIIRDALGRRLTVPRSDRELEAGVPREVSPGDFMIVTRNTKHLSVYARALQDYGIPHQVTGGTALNEVGELRLLHTALTAVVQPDNPVSLVAALRSELFGVSDAALYAFHKAGGRFDYNEPVPGGLSADDAAAFSDAFTRLRTCARRLHRFPPVAAIESIVADLGLMALAAARPGGDIEAGSVAKAIELLRAAEAQTWSAAQLVDYLGQLAVAEEKHDGISALSAERPVVRVMNLHKVKGLEAPVVFLADPTGEKTFPPDVHIDRSGGKVTGVMAVRGRERGWGPGPLLAQPEEWEVTYREREAAFMAAEATRLRYVAATRAGALLVVTQRSGRGKGNNPWKYFTDALEDAPTVADPGAVAKAEMGGEDLSAAQIDEACAAVAGRLDAARRATYDARGAKHYALDLEAAPPDGVISFAPPETEPAAAPSDGEHGVEWGSVIHELLALAMKKGDAALEDHARTALGEHQLGEERAADALAVVRSVIGSDIWKRAARSEQCFVEAPFQVLSPPAADGPAVPTILRGVIDLVFRDGDGWTVVDYKTDNVAAGLDVLSGRYAPQVRLYARAWEECIGEPVTQMGLYFTTAGEFVPLPREG